MAIWTVLCVSSYIMRASDIRGRWIVSGIINDDRLLLSPTFFWIGYNLRRDMISVFKSFLKWTDIMMPLTLHSSISPLGKKAIKMFPGPHIYQGPRKWMERLSICFYIAGQSRTRLDAWIVRMRRRRRRKKSNETGSVRALMLHLFCSRAAQEIHVRCFSPFLFTSHKKALLRLFRPNILSSSFSIQSNKALIELNTLEPDCLFC